MANRTVRIGACLRTCSASGLLTIQNVKKIERMFDAMLNWQHCQWAR